VEKNPMKTPSKNQPERPSEAELNTRRVKLLQPESRNLTYPKGTEWVWHNKLLGDTKQPPGRK
jgi:hypothetical protein